MNTESYVPKLPNLGYEVDNRDPNETELHTCKGTLHVSPTELFINMVENCYPDQLEQVLENIRTLDPDLLT